MYLKRHKSQEGGDVVAVCDRELINTTVREKTLTVIISDYFYGTTLKPEEEVRAELRTATNINLIGERAVNLAIEMDLLDRSECIHIGKIPHAQIYRL